ncbi:hypothetical protein THAOC_06312 [Thalassiosira oceanica]|uniref:Uncharacterized protein n=1 Tax=Thalassiosira oceanica TaxID=159749 RepID=K0TLW1_THAOC|nr:hypothetical protein THAOC_06312 [Thalassiosira oceanica]|eukprot:EJK72182.1 hypothetical protein THAOC_06312 [Thalassiosira oceanica]
MRSACVPADAEARGRSRRCPPPPPGGRGPRTRTGRGRVDVPRTGVRLRRPRDGGGRGIRDACPEDEDDGVFGLDEEVTSARGADGDDGPEAAAPNEEMESDPDHPDHHHRRLGRRSRPTRANAWRGAPRSRTIRSGGAGSRVKRKGQGQGLQEVQGRRGCARGAVRVGLWSWRKEHVTFKQSDGRETPAGRAGATAAREAPVPPCAPSPRLAPFGRLGFNQQSAATEKKQTGGSALVVQYWSADGRAERTGGRVCLLVVTWKFSRSFFLPSPSFGLAYTPSLWRIFCLSGGQVEAGRVDPGETQRCINLPPPMRSMTNDVEPTSGWRAANKPMSRADERANKSSRTDRASA